MRPLNHGPGDINHVASEKGTMSSRRWRTIDDYAHLISVRESELSAKRASAWVDMTMKPRRREALSMVARMTACATLPYLENISINSFLVTS